MSCRVFNAGKIGDTTSGMRSRFTTDAAARAPETVILWAGVNDMIYPGHTAEFELFTANYRQLIANCRLIGAELLLGTLPGQIMEYALRQFPEMAAMRPTPEERLKRANEFIFSLNLPTADFAALIASRPLAESPQSFLQTRGNSKHADGMHLSEAGAKASGELAAEMLAKFSLPTGRIVCLGDSLTYGCFLPGKGSADPDGATYPGVLCKILNREQFSRA